MNNNFGAPTPDSTGFSYNGTSQTVNVDSSGGSIRQALSIMTGIGLSSTNIGEPSDWHWLFSFIFFWIPMFMLMWAIYMSLPFIH